jgi:hypothetical protein
VKINQPSSLIYKPALFREKLICVWVHFVQKLGGLETVKPIPTCKTLGIGLHLSDESRFACDYGSLSFVDVRSRVAQIADVAKPVVGVSVPHRIHMYSASAERYPQRHGNHCVSRFMVGTAFNVFWFRLVHFVARQYILKLIPNRPRNW